MASRWPGETRSGAGGCLCAAVVAGSLQAGRWRGSRGALGRRGAARERPPPLRPAHGPRLSRRRSGRPGPWAGAAPGERSGGLTGGTGGAWSGWPGPCDGCKGFLSERRFVTALLV